MATCPSALSCPFFVEVEASLIKRVRFAAAFPYCNAGRHTECALYGSVAIGSKPPAGILPDGSFGEYLGSGRDAAEPAVCSIQHRYLVIEDSPIFAGFAANALRNERPDAEVVVCNGFDEAQRHLADDKFTLVVSGYGVGGGKTVHDIRALCDAPIVLFTGRDDCEVGTLGKVRVAKKSGGSAGLRDAMAALLGA